MALIPTQQLTRDGVVIYPTSDTVCTGNDTFVNTGNQILIIRNNGLADTDIEVYLKIFPESGPSTILMKVIPVNSGQIAILDRLPPQTYSDPVTGLAVLTIQAGRPVNNILYNVYKLGTN